MANITFLDGNPEVSGQLEETLAVLVDQLEQRGHTVRMIHLRERPLDLCTGCWSCWLKTPGQCRSRDNGDAVRSAWLHADLVVLASPLRAGFVSALLKTAVDKFIPLAHPYIELRNGECTHRHRYASLPPLASLIEPGPSDDDADVQINIDWVARVAEHTRAPLAFGATTATPVADILAKIEAFLAQPTTEPDPLPRPAPVPIPALPDRDDTQRLLILNGSARAKSNTAILIEHLKTGFEQRTGNEVVVHRLGGRAQRERALAAWNEADLVLIAMPLYVHAMPGHLKGFFEELEDAPRLPGRRVGFLVQSGFPEPHQSRWLEPYLARLPARWGAEFLGTAVRGGVEGIQMQPANFTRGLFEQVETLGEALGRTGRLDPTLVRTLRGRESLSLFARLMFSLARLVGLTDWMWNTQLRKNGAFPTRFAQPLLEDRLEAPAPRRTARTEPESARA